jgi:GT2 family glycosyltransferase
VLDATPASGETALTHGADGDDTPPFVTNEPATVAVILTCYNRRDRTLECLRRLRVNESSTRALSVYLVDDASSDGTADAVRASFPEVHVIEGSGDLFWGGGMRLAFEHAVPSNPEFLLWLNDDVELDDDAISRLLEIAMALSPGEIPAIVVGSTRDPITGATTYGGIDRTNRLARMKFTMVEPDSAVRACETMNGNIVLIPRVVYETVGNIDRKFAHWIGDFDYGLRASVAGFRVLVAPGHYGSCVLNVGTFFDQRLGRRERFRIVLTPKGLPPSQWATFCRRYGGPLWPWFAISPYVRLVIQGGRHRRTVA